jgi:hypothetical protein
VRGRLFERKSQCVCMRERDRESVCIQGIDREWDSV